MNEVQNKFTVLLEANRLNDMKNNKRNEDLQNFMTETRNCQQEQEQKQSNAEATNDFNSRALAAILQHMNLNALPPSPCGNNINNVINNHNQQHQHPQNYHQQQQQQQQQQQSHVPVTPNPQNRNDPRLQHPQPPTQPTDNTTNNASPRSRGTAGQ